MRCKILILCLTFLLAACGTPRPTATPVTYAVEYKLGGTTSWADVTLKNATGGTEQKEGVSVKDFKMGFPAALGQFVYLSAQNTSETGTVRCEIYVNGKLWKEAESSGAYSIASCNGSVGR